MDPRHKIFDQNSRDLHAFFKRVGRIWIYEELKFLGLEPQMISGEFWSDGVSNLTEFCKANPGYHIISSTEGKVFNKFIPSSHFYFLADGDDNPDLMIDLWAHLNIQDFLEIRQAKATSILGKINGGD